MWATTNSSADIRADDHPPSVAPKQDELLTFTFVTDGV